MTEQDGVAMKSTNGVKGKIERQDDLIMETNSSSIVSKRSVERLYFPNESHFYRYFVKKPQRRSPLINRGYWLRMKAVDHAVRQFLEPSSTKPKIVINLGCGYDPLFWQSMTRYPTVCSNVKFVDIDYRELMIKKRDVIQKTEELNLMLTNVEIDVEDLLLRSDQYLQIGCDLRDLPQLQQKLAKALDLENSFILLVAEVSITYMNVEAADALIAWAGRLPAARFCLLEQIVPGGPDHPFARTMLAHFNKLQSPLKAVLKYPSEYFQQKRFRDLGWNDVSVRNLWELWSDPDILNSSERMAFDAIEPFDEWEEFALFGCHYFLLIADAIPIKHENHDVLGLEIQSEANEHPAHLPFQANVYFSKYPKKQGHRRFAAALPIRSPHSDQDRVGNFAGMGLNSRVSSCDVYSTKRLGEMPFRTHHGAGSGPSSRMCHTITDLGDAGALLVGGRTSPDNALWDCWLYHKWLNIWERVDDLPLPRYRHFAVYLGSGCILVGSGKSDSQNIVKDYLVWSRRLGWVQCTVVNDEKPCPTFSTTALALSDDRLEASKCGILAGGISKEGILQQDTCDWYLSTFTSKKPTITFRTNSESANGVNITRFGASTFRHHGRLYILGGIIREKLLTAENEICCFKRWGSMWQRVKSKYNNPLTPRPLLNGISAISTGDTILIMGGSAVCFSFGTFWNEGCYTLDVIGPKQQYSTSPPESWEYLHTLDLGNPKATPMIPTAAASSGNAVVTIPRLRLTSASEFERILSIGRPVIFEGLDLGPCVEGWTASYLKENVGNERKVIVHESPEKHMDFEKKNFAYTTKLFGNFIDEVETGGKLYLRSLSHEKPSELPAHISKDFPSISGDFRLPPELRLVMENAHSSPLRISGPVNMWLHYDVMANILCQIRSPKRLLLFPPSDISYFDFAPGASSSSINIFDNLGQDSTLNPTHPHEALLNPGDVLFLPSLWLHTASRTSNEMSVAVNIFFRNLQGVYAAGKDVYGNRDLQAYEKGRQDIGRIVKGFEDLPDDVRGFYLKRLVKELAVKAVSGGS